MRSKSKTRGKNISLSWKGRREKSLKEYLLNRIEKRANGCWIWKRARIGRYGTVEYKNKTKSAHRASYELFVGKIPNGLILRHKCDETRCINPNHLTPGTKKDNRLDFMKRNPKAMEICLRSAKIGAAGVKRFWERMTDQERKRFIKKRAKIQKEKYPFGARNGTLGLGTGHRNERPH